MEGKVSTSTWEPGDELRLQTVTFLRRKLPLRLLLQLHSLTYHLICYIYIQCRAVISTHANFSTTTSLLPVVTLHRSAVVVNHINSSSNNKNDVLSLSRHGNFSRNKPGATNKSRHGCISESEKRKSRHGSISRK